MPTPRVAVALTPLDRPVRAAIHAAAEMDADGVQFELGRDFTVGDMTESARRQLLHELDERRLGVAALHLPLQRGLCELDGLDARIDRLKAALQLAYQLRADSVTFRIGRVPVESASMEYETLAAVLNDLARHANRVGSMPSIIPSADDAEAIAALVSRVREGPLGVCLDPAIAVAGGKSPPAVYRALVDVVSQLLVRDAVRDVDGAVVEVPLGRGEVPWDELLALVNEAAFSGWLTATRTQGDDKPGDLRRAVLFVRNVLAG